MGMFGSGEPYSPRNFHEATENAAGVKEDLETAEKNRHRYSKIGMANIREGLAEKQRLAQDRIDNLKGQAKIEATEKNKEYSQLLKTAEDAIQAVENYERNILNMSSEDDGEKIAG